MGPMTRHHWGSSHHFSETRFFGCKDFKCSNIIQSGAAVVLEWRFGGPKSRVQAAANLAGAPKSWMAKLWRFKTCYTLPTKLDQPGKVGAHLCWEYVKNDQFSA
eukprot:1142234-Pelagomonas_calceolata.AAC.1